MALNGDEKADHRTLIGRPQKMFTAAPRCDKIALRLSGLFRWDPYVVLQGLGKLES